MVKLYRSTAHLHHWIAYADDIGWVVFPAQVNGWNRRQAATGLHPGSLFEIPLWLAFNKGLPDAVRNRQLANAA
jgi:hypothetical protein